MRDLFSALCAWSKAVLFGNPKSTAPFLSALYTIGLHHRTNKAPSHWDNQSPAQHSSRPASGEHNKSLPWPTCRPALYSKSKSVLGPLSCRPCRPALATFQSSSLSLAALPIKVQACPCCKLSAHAAQTLHGQVACSPVSTCK